MANLPRVAKPAHEWTFSDLDAFNIALQDMPFEYFIQEKDQSTEVLVTRPLPGRLQKLDTAKLTDNFTAFPVNLDRR